MIFHENTISGWWLTYPSEKYEWTSVGMMKFPIFGKSFKIPWFQSPPARFCHDKSTRLISEKWKIGKVVLQVTASRASWSSPWRCLWRSEWLQMMGFGGVCEGFCTYCTLFRGMGSLIILNLIVIRMSRILKFSGSWWIERNGGISWVIRWRVNVLHGNWSMFCLDLLAWVCLGIKGTETEHTSEDPAEMFSLW